MIPTVALYIDIEMALSTHVVWRSLEVKKIDSLIPQAWATGVKNAARMTTAKVVRTVTRTMMVGD